MKATKQVKRIRLFPAVLGIRTTPTQALMDKICQRKYGPEWKYDNMDGKHCYKIVEVNETK